MYHYSFEQIKQTIKELVLAFGVMLLLIQFMGCVGAHQDRRKAYASIRGLGSEIVVKARVNRALARTVARE